MALECRNSDGTTATFPPEVKKGIDAKLASNLQAASVIQGKATEENALALFCMMNELNEKAEELTDNDIEHRLSLQFLTLEQQFYAVMGAEVLGVDLQLATKQTALKIQTECRKTAEAIHKIRHPKQGATFIKQSVQQQIVKLEQTVEEQQQQLQKLEVLPGGLDGGAQTETPRDAAEGQTVAEIDGTPKRRRKGSKRSKRA